VSEGVLLLQAMVYLLPKANRWRCLCPSWALWGSGFETVSRILVSKKRQMPLKH
jgi:hypothetical protein